MKVELKWISVEDRLPNIGDEVFVIGHYVDYPNCKTPIFTNRRADNSRVTDGNGFYRLSEFKDVVITHWFYIPKFEKL